MPPITTDDFVDTIAVPRKPMDYRPLKMDRYSTTGDTSRAASSAPASADDWTPAQAARIAGLRRKPIVSDGAMVMLVCVLLVAAIAFVVVISFGAIASIF